LNRKKPPNDKTAPPIKDPITAPVITGVLLDGGDGGGDVGGEDGGGVVVGVEDDIISGIEGSKVVVHLYLSLLLISSNKISLSIFES